MSGAGERMHMALGSHALTYTLRRSARRTLEVRLTPAGEVVVSAPYLLPRGEIEAFLSRRQNWIAQKRKALAQSAAQSAAALPLVTGDVLRYRGGFLKLMVYPALENKVDMRGGELCVWTADTRREAVRALILAFYMRAALAEVERQMPDCVRRVGKAPQSVTVRDMTTRWGSCSSRGSLSINWKLVMAPPSVMGYVIVHELCHLDQPNHSPAFWALVERAWPSFEDDKRFLRQNGASLGI